VAILLILLITSIVTGVLIKDKGILEKNNVAVAVLAASILISTAMLCSDSLSMAQTAIKNAITSHMGSSFIMKASVIGLLQLILAVVLALVIAFISVKLYDFMTPNIEEMEEIVKKNNIAIGILMAAIVIALTIFIRAPFSDLLLRIAMPLLAG
jgi:uncharacterized membrane protein YjfL (UPF0719 family)